MLESFMKGTLKLGDTLRALAGSHKHAWAGVVQEAYAELNAEKVRSGQGGLPVIIYSSRTHSQLQQVMKELRNSGYRQAWC